MMDSVRKGWNLVNRWRLRREALAVVQMPYGEPPFPFTCEQWEEYCRNEEAAAASGPDKGK